MKGFLVENLRVLVVPERDIEHVPAIHPIEAVVRGAVQIDEPRCDPRVVRLLVDLQVSHLQEEWLLVQMLVGLQSIDHTLHIVANPAVRSNETAVRIAQDSPGRLEVEEERAAAQERFVIRPNLMAPGGVPHQLLQQLTLAANPLQEWLRVTQLRRGTHDRRVIGCDSHRHEPSFSFFTSE